MYHVLSIMFGLYMHKTGGFQSVGPGPATSVSPNNPPGLGPSGLWAEETCRPVLVQFI